MMTTRRNQTIAASVMFTLIAVSAIFSLTAWLTGAGRSDARVANELRIYLEARQAVMDRYVTPVDSDDFLFGAINGAMEKLDRHSVFLPPVEAKRFSESISAHFEGIGVQVRLVDGWFTIFSPWRGSPAHTAGIEAGDRIVGVDGKPVAHPLDDKEFKRLIDENIRGKPGTTVILSVSRVDSPVPLSIPVRRGDVHVPSVQDSRLLSKSPALAYLRLDGFSGGGSSSSENSAAEIQSALKALDDQAGGSISGLIFDLRDNPGGLLNQAIAVSNLFLSQGTIVSSRSRTETEIYDADPSKTQWGNAPIIILIDDGSASASEIVAGCLRDHQRAFLVGKTSFGKGLVQSSQEMILPPKDGDPDRQSRKATLKLTTAKYYTPNGNDIQDIGIPPDVEIRTDSKQWKKIYDVRERLFVEYNREKPSAKDIDDALTAEMIEADVQLSTALSILRDTLNLSTFDEKRAVVEKAADEAKRRNAVSASLDAGVSQYVERYRTYLR